MRFLRLGAVALVLLFGVLLFRTVSLTSRRIESAAPVLAGEVDPDRVAGHLASAIRFRTISRHDGGDGQANAFRGFERYLESTYPHVHRALDRERVAAHSLLFTWKGRDAAAPALLLAAHHDVVPVDPGSEESWTHPPFAGVVADGFVWGRGAIDDKGCLISILEAVESLLAEGFVPERSVILAFGHDEEIGGHHGAKVIAATLAERGVAIGSVLDEGGVVSVGMVEWIDDSIAVIGVAEKGSVSLALRTETDGGHSSIPAPQSAVGIVAAAVAALESRPMPARIGETTGQFLEFLAPELPFPARMAIANLWLTEGLLVRAFASVRPLNAMVRTTTAATIIHGGVKANVLPRNAEAVVNFRILPGDTVDDVARHVRRVVADERIAIGPSGATRPREPSGVSPVDSAAFAQLRRVIAGVFPDAISVPYLVVGGTDARHYDGLTPNVYRFNPFRAGTEQLKLAHGTDERIEVTNLVSAVRFYRTLIAEPPAL